MEARTEDPWGGRTPWLRRRGWRAGVAVLTAASFLVLTLMSTCSPRRTVAPTTTTTTTAVPGIQAVIETRPG